jgi:2-polyprenyl-3-methyl-5-hydroxy-6-metoxy-1,4-benzoquinol methylase
MTCRACGGIAMCASHEASEMMFRTGGSYVYHECAACGSLTLANPPDGATQYPEKYYRHLELRVSPSMRWYVKALRIAYDRCVPIVSPLSGRWGMGLRGTSDTRARVLDVGCGAGRMLERLRDLGMQDLTGVDPYGVSSCAAANGRSGSLRLVRGLVEDVDRTFDIIVLNHSLEHVEDPAAVLAAVKALLSANGRAVVRTPLVGYSWRRYGRFWVQLYAPRHLTIFSQRGLLECARRAGLRVERFTYDSTAFQFSGSEDYLRGSTPRAGRFADIARRLVRSIAGAWAVRAWVLNHRRDGDQAAFVLRCAA